MNNAFNVARAAMCGVALASTAGLTGCANMYGASEQVVDDQKIYLIDKWAMRNGVTVIWLNPPRRNKPEATPTATPTLTPTPTRSPPAF